MRSTRQRLPAFVSGLRVLVLLLCSAFCSALSFACSEDEQTPASDAPDGPLLESDCDPLVPSACGFPFPSNVYLKSDPDKRNPSGKSVRFGAATLPKTQGTTPVAPALFYDLDGFSPGQAPMTHMPGATASGLSTPDTIERSLAGDSPTILLDAETLERIPHFVDVDQSAVIPDDQRALLIRPVVRLKDGTRYIVAIRRVLDASGQPIAPSEVFRALRDGTTHTDPSVKSRRRFYAELFSKLASAGVPKQDLQIVWDYTTSTRENVTAHMLHMRDDALATVGADGPEFVVKGVQEQPHPEILRRITLTMTVPLYLTSGADWDAASNSEPRLVLNGASMPTQNGTMEMDVLVHVPNSVTTGAKHGLLQNGHGLFGSKTEGQGGYLPPIANQYKWLIFATDFYGFRSADVPMAATALSTQPALLRSFVDRQHQGHLNQLLAMRMMMGRVARSGITGADGTLLLDPAVIDANVRAYRGDSQGGIMGTVYMALSTDVTRGLLGEAGFPYNLLLNRSVDWAAYNLVLDSSYKSPLDKQIMLGLIQMAWDRSEPSGYAPYLSQNMLPNTPAHQVLLHDAIGDHQVTTFGTHLLARTIGAKNIRSNDSAQPLVRDIWGVPAADAPFEGGSALVEYDFALPKEPLSNMPANQGCDPHDRVRQLGPSYQQQDEFFRTGRVIWFCDGVCNCDGAREERGCPETLCK